MNKKKRLNHLCVSSTSNLSVSGVASTSPAHTSGFVDCSSFNSIRVLGIYNSKVDLEFQFGSSAPAFKGTGLFSDGSSHRIRFMPNVYTAVSIPCCAEMVRARLYNNSDNASAKGDMEIIGTPEYFGLFPSGNQIVDTLGNP